MEIPGYAIERELGDGAMATVYLATQRSLERKVALKVMAAALAADRSFCERFLREGKTLARLSHPHTVTIYDIGNVGHFYYMAMEYLPNGTLKERIAEGSARSRAWSTCARSPWPWVMPMPRGWCTETSSRPISCSAPTVRRCSRTSASPSPWRTAPSSPRPVSPWAHPAT